MRIDAHQHFWRLDRGDYHWLTEDMTALYRDFGPNDLEPHLGIGRIEATIAVQAAPTEEETEFLLDMAANHNWIAGVVGWADLEATNAVTRIARLARRDRLVGLRPMLQDLPDVNWISRASIAPALRAMEMHGLVLDALVRAEQIDLIHDLAWRHPGLVIVLDHAGKPPLMKDLTEWRASIARLANCPNVYVKLSGLLTEATDGADARSLRPLYDNLLFAFGASRLLWGSDWPVVTSKANYAQWLKMAERLIAGLSESERDAVMGGNAAHVYGIATVREPQPPRHLPA
ncbi:MAG: amidohydrolase [Sphingobium sp.]|uniref:amidohydrolase family protein n=1 Tax=Sphingobium sp. TaxID=1912891 RepID=UPI000DB8BA3F|nr:amidohydrolase family protein [Sphingobium sp.]PZU12236.1 MAG: amidohydrolase [Sphingobium sp.]